MLHPEESGRSDRDEIVGADLPDWLRSDPNHNAIVGATWGILFLAAVWLIILVVSHP